MLTLVALLGLMVGTCLGVLVAALCAAGREWRGEEAEADPRRGER